MRTIVVSAIVLTAALAATDAKAACRTVTLAGQPLFDDCKLIRMKRSPGELEVVRFPRGSSNPTYIVLMELLPGVPPNCTEEERHARNGSCSHNDVCMFVIDVNPAKLPILDALGQLADETNGELRLFAAENVPGRGSVVSLGFDARQLVARTGETLRIPDIDVRANAAGCWIGIHAQYGIDLARFYK
jgi:hypothetical protein